MSEQRTTALADEFHSVQETDDSPLKCEQRQYIPMLDSWEFGSKLVELGIVPKHCVGVKIEAEMDGPVTITARYYADERLDGCLESIATWKAERRIDS